MLMNINTLDWDDEMLRVLDIPRVVLPKIKSSSEIYGHRRGAVFIATTQGGTAAPLQDVPVSGDLGDQHAALFGQACFNPGEAKNTYGTGCFMLLNTGELPVQSKAGLLTTMGYKIGDQTCRVCT